MGFLAIRPPPLAHLLRWIPPFPASPCRVAFQSWSPHTLALNCNFSLGPWGGATSHATAAAGSAEWHHLPLSQEASTRSGLEQPSWERKHANHLHLFALRSEITAQSNSALCVCKLMSKLLSWHSDTAGASFLGHHPVYTRWRHGRWMSTSRPSLLEVIRPSGDRLTHFLGPSCMDVGPITMG